jgi:hypothetical protein
MKSIITMCLSTVLALLLVAQTLKKYRPLLDSTTMDATAVSLTTELRQAIQESLANNASQPPPVLETLTRLPFPLPRDPFNFRPPPAPQFAPPPLPSQPAPQELPLSPPSPLAAEETLRLKATIIDRYGTMAFINDQVLTVGQSILGYTVVHIAAGQVELARHGK